VMGFLGPTAQSELSCVKKVGKVGGGGERVCVGFVCVCFRGQKTPGKMGVCESARGFGSVCECLRVCMRVCINVCACV